MSARPSYRRRQKVAQVISAIALCVSCADTETIDGFPKEYVGVGIELTIDKKFPNVVRPIDGGPSESAGVMPGDVLTDINGKSTEGLSLGDVVVKLRGRPNSQVTLGLRRDGTRILVVLRRRAMAKVSGNYEKKEANNP